MSIIWGSWQNTSSNGMRIGYRVSRTSVSSGSSSVLFTVRIYTQNRYVFADNQHIDFGSYLGSRHSFYNGSRGGAVLRATRTYRYSYSDWGRSRTLTSSARVGGVWSGLSPSVTIRLRVPARPYRAPLAPTGLALSNQHSSGAVTLSWNNRRNNGTGRPYTSQRIEVSYYHSSGSWTGWNFLATVSSGASSYRYTNMYQNTRYQFRVRANNSAGSSGWSGTVATNTVPRAPTNARARVQSSGNDIQITWTRNNQRGDSVIFHQVQRQISSGGSWSTVASRLSSGTSSWIDSNPNAGYNRYRVRSFLDNSLITQYSGWSTAPAITTIVPPLAPTNVTVSPRVPDFTRETTISWTHRDGGDGADQSDYEFQYAYDDGDWTGITLGSEASHLEEYPLPADTLENGQRIRIRVRTRGNTQEGFGPWSSPVEITGWTTPTVTLVEDEPPEIVQTIPFIVEWVYNQDEDRDQLSADVEVWSTIGPYDEVERDQRVLVHRIRGTATSQEISHLLEDGEQYVVRVRATSSREQTSTWDERVITIDLLPPARVSLRPQYDTDTGVMVLEVEPHEPRYGVEDTRNLISNPRFRQPGERNNITNPYGIVTQSDSQLIVEVTRWHGSAERMNKVIDIAEPGTYTYTIRMKIPDTSTSQDWSQHLGIDVIRNNPPRDAGDGWTDYSMTFSVAEPSQATLRLYVRNSQIGDIWYIYGESLVPGEDSMFFDGSMDPDEAYAYRWAGEPDNSPSIKYELVEHVEGDDAPPFEAGVDTFDIQRSIDDGEWITIISGVDATLVDEGDGDEASVISLMDLLPAINGRNRYRLILYSFAPSVGATSPVEVPVGPQENQGWTFMNYGPDMGSVLRVGNNVEVDESMETSGTDQPLAGRKRPVSLFGEHETRTLSISGNLHHDELQPAPSSQSPLDSPPEDWRMAQREANTVCLRTPAGHRIYGRMNGLNMATSNLNVTSLSFSVVENDFREDESSGAGVEVSN